MKITSSNSIVVDGCPLGKLTNRIDAVIPFVVSRNFDLFVTLKIVEIIFYFRMSLTTFVLFGSCMNTTKLTKKSIIDV